MPPRNSKAPRRSASHTDVTSSAAHTSATTLGKHRVKTVWAEVHDFEGFRIRYEKFYRGKDAKTGQKRKFQAEYDQQDDKNPVQENPFDGTSLPATLYHIEPADMWEDTSRYRKFTIGPETFSVGDYVFIKPSEDENPTPDAPIKAWVAKVLEVRAGNENHVYLRVYWMYRPEDLPCGRLPYHAKSELIASNYMQVIDATTVEYKADVIHWVEQNNKNEVIDDEQLFWRQTIDTSQKKNKLSGLPLHCIDNAPCNPDVTLIQCTSCHKWLHGACLEQAAVRDAYNKHNILFPGGELEEEEGAAAPTPQTQKKRARKSTAKASLNGATNRLVSKKPKGKQGLVKNEPAEGMGLAYELPSDLLFTAQVVNEDSVTKLVVTDLRPGQNFATHVVPLKCLLCHKDIDASNADSESEKGVSVNKAKGKKPLSPATTEQTASKPEREKKDSVVKSYEESAMGEKFRNETGETTTTDEAGRTTSFP
ncbi:hypothetical protein GQ43DRAFT_260884 [Delitschia confertaspora ATCC 74209]|uniref:BAH domain-containing protein n=1 Tax=Delitschia confertaspora ATCC 74209 TaxID=1513339 RepID=A0A9P4JGQ5_9PLEO|nr:hypothetical protein GQ43DRAFT_260884 [Delitschia confertaspora ATCC 74209]